MFFDSLSFGALTYVELLTLLAPEIHVFELLTLLAPGIHVFELLFFLE
jgi:hypothetical protein